ncbi:hypothetical protein B566_EDAN010403 [Ephemera danica]|nr:hypothetical protein B566_EDAN010403 [Ephemera danica]
MLFHLFADGVMGDTVFGSSSSGNTAVPTSGKHRAWESQVSAQSNMRETGGSAGQSGGESNRDEVKPSDSPAASLAEILDTAFTSSVDNTPQDHCGADMECEPLFAEGDGMPELTSYPPRRLHSNSPREGSPSPQTSADSFMFSASARDGSDFMHYLASPMGASAGPGGPGVSEEDSRDNPFLRSPAWGNIDHIENPTEQVCNSPFYQVFHNYNSPSRRSSSPSRPRLLPYGLRSPPSPLSPLTLPNTPRSLQQEETVIEVRPSSPMDCEEGGGPSGMQNGVYTSLEDPRRKYKRLLSQEPVSHSVQSSTQIISVLEISVAIHKALGINEAK